MTDGEQTTPTDTAGNETDPTTAEPTSLYDKTEAIVTRQEEANKKAEEILTRQETLQANQRLAGTAGGGIPTKTKAEVLNDAAAEEAKGIVDAFR